MDVLKDKQYKESDTLSRYTTSPIYYHTVDKKYMVGLMLQMSEDITYVDHKVAPTDTLESIAFKYYGRPDFYWAIAEFNNINDSFMKLYPKFKKLKVPSISNITFR